MLHVLVLICAVGQPCDRDTARAYFTAHSCNYYEAQIIAAPFIQAGEEIHMKCEGKR
jgi:hypothetical protein